MRSMHATIIYGDIPIRLYSFLRLAGVGSKNFSNLSTTPFHSSASGGGSPLRAILGQASAYWRVSVYDIFASASPSVESASTRELRSHPAAGEHVTRGVVRSVVA